MSDPVLAPVPYEAFVADVRAVAARIAEDAAWQPDYLIGIGRGGLVPGAYLSHAAGLTLLSVDLSARDVGFGEELLAKLAAKTGAGKRLLIVDDINDSGATIAAVRRAIEDAGGSPDNVRVAVLITNVRSAAVADYWSRTIDRAEDKHWFVFPWEAMADRATIVEDAEAVPDRLA